MIEKEQYLEWLESEVTKDFFSKMEERIKDKTEYLVEGGTLGEEAEQRTANCIGYIGAYSELLTMNSKEFLDDWED